jgi:putative membrane protein
MAEPVRLFEWVRLGLPWIVLALAVALVWGEPHGLGPERWPGRRRRLVARCASVGVFLAAGVYGLVIFRVPMHGLIPVPPSPLLPALSGLFGAATILTSAMATARVPHQFVRMHPEDLSRRGAVVGLSVGVAAGAAMSVLPGLTSASATGLVASMRRGGGDAETVVGLSSVNTANALFNLAMLWLFLKTRSGAVVAIEAIVDVSPWRTAPPNPLVLLLLVAWTAGFASLLLTLGIGRFLVRRLQRIPYRKLLAGVLVYMLVSVVLFTGLPGLVAFATATALGVVPVRLGLRRVPLTGVLLVPVLTYLWL